MPRSDTVSDILGKLSEDISTDVGNITDKELDKVSSIFDNTLNDALKTFNSSTFDSDGFIKKMGNIELEGKDRDTMKNILNGVKSDFIGVENLNHNELLMRRDMDNICVQMPEMRDVIYLIRDSIIECNVSTGEVSRSLSFLNHTDTESYESRVKEIETRHDLLMATKNFIVPNTLKSGEMYIQVIPYSKLFAEVDAIKDSRFSSRSKVKRIHGFTESVPNYVMREFKESVSLYNEKNVKSIMESVSSSSKIDSVNDFKSTHDNTKGKLTKDDDITKESVSSLLKNIDVYNGSSVMLSEMGADGFEHFLLTEYAEYQKKNPSKKSRSKLTHFSEAMSDKVSLGSDFDEIDQDEINFKSFSDIKGCYIKYLDPLRMVPIRMDRRIIGYYYVSTTMDMTNHPANPTGMVDLSYQSYTRDRNMVDNLASMIIKSFDKKFLEKNINLKNEIAEIIMAHKFSEGKLSFIYIPENEVVRMVINEDENGKGHSVIEPVMFPARNYMLLSMYNMIYTLNNNTTRVHYLRSSGLNKDYAAQIQRTMRKFQSRRITVDDIYSYSGVLNKVGGMGEMVLPIGRNDFKALDTDTIEAVPNPISVEFLEQQRRQALSGTGAPNLLVINALDEVDFAKTLEMANTRFLSTVSSYKIDMNKGLTTLYQRLMKYETDIEDDVISSFRYQFNAIKQQELVITAEMIQNYNSMVEMVESIYYSKNELEDEKGNPTSTRRNLRKELAREYVPQLDYDKLDDIIKRVNLASRKEQIEDRVKNTKITDEDLNTV